VHGRLQRSWDVGDGSFWSKVEKNIACSLLIFMMTVMRSWVSRIREAPTGPYAEDQLRGMWTSGSVLGDDQVCAIGTFHDWIFLRPLIDTFEVNRKDKVDPRENTEKRLALGSKRYERRQKIWLLQ
jgi:hypothetical protein